MGAFYLTKKRRNIETAISEFQKLGLNNYCKRTFKDFTLVLFKKAIIKINNFIEEETFFIGAVGTPVYKGLSYSEGLKNLFSDLKNNCFDKDLLAGHYNIFFWDGKKLRIIIDNAGLLKIFCDQNGDTLSSSFIVISETDFSVLILNRKSVIENIVTGGITGSKTLFNEILVYNPIDSKVRVSDIEFCTPEEKEIVPYGSKEHALEDQISILVNYFRNLKRFADEFGLDSGLTGGYDSRLLLALIQKCGYEDFQVHSHFRSGKDKEWLISREIALDERIEFVSPPPGSVTSMTKSEKETVFENSFKFYDGQIRSNCFWNEEYNTLSYRLKVLNSKRLGFHGIGGEQYRNVERLNNNTYSFHKWLKYKLVRKLSGKAFLTKHDEEEFIGDLKDEINNRLKFHSEKVKINLLDIKRIQNEVLIDSFRGARTHAENKISFFLSPFSDKTVSYRAYAAVPFFDGSFNFQRQMINSISPVLASYKSVYGYPLNSGESLFKYLSSVLAENLLPFNISWFLADIYKRYKHRNFILKSHFSEEPYNEYIEKVNQLCLPLKTEKLLRRPDISPLIVSVGYFLKRYQHKLIP